MASLPDLLLLPALVVSLSSAPQPPVAEAPEPESAQESTDEQDADAPGPLEQPAAGPAPPARPPAAPPVGLLPLVELSRFTYSPSERPSLLVDETRLIVVTASGIVDAYDLVTGEPSWKLGLPGESFLPPVRAPGEKLVVAIVSASGKLLTLDGEDGSILAEHELGLTPALPPLYSERTGGDFVLATKDDEIVAFDSTSEPLAERWRVRLDERPMALERDDSSVFVSGGTQSIFALDARTGEPRWRFRARGAIHAPVAADERREALYVGDDAGDFYSLDTKDGKVRFRWSTGAAIRHQALVGGRRVFVTTFGNTLFAYDSGNGHEQWRANLPGRPASGARRVNRRLLVWTLDGTLVEFQPASGNRTETGQTPGEPYRPPSVYLAPAAGAVPGAAARAGPEPEDELDPEPEEEIEPELGSEPDPGARELRSSEASDAEPQPPRGPPGQGSAAEPLPPSNDRSRVALALRSGDVVLLAREQAAPPPNPAEAEAAEQTENEDPAEPRRRPSPPP